MNRTTLALIVLLAASLAWAYQSGKAPGPMTQEALETVWTVPADQVQRVEYRSGDTRITVTVTARQGRPGKYYWVEAEGLHERRPRPQQRKGNRPVPADAEDDQPANDAFQGNLQAQRFIEEIATLQAVRDLGPAKDFNLADFGLTGDAQAHVQLELGAGKPPLRLDLGAPSAAGATRYGLSSQNNRVYLVRGASFRMLANARRMMERDLFPFPLQEAQTIEVQLGGKKVTLHKLDLPPTEPLRWGWAAGDKKGDPLLQEVANGLVRIRALRYLPGGFDPAKASVTLSATATKAGEPPATLTVYREGKEDVPALSSHTERAVGLNAGLVNSLLKSVRAAMPK